MAYHDCPLKGSTSSWNTPMQIFTPNQWTETGDHCGWIREQPASYKIPDHQPRNGKNTGLSTSASTAKNENILQSDLMRTFYITLVWVKLTEIYPAHTSTNNLIHKYYYFFLFIFCESLAGELYHLFCFFSTDVMSDIYSVNDEIIVGKLKIFIFVLHDTKH